MEYEAMVRRLGKTVAEIRADRGLTQEQLVESTGLHRNSISMIERGVRNVTVRQLHQLAAGLDVPVKEFFRDL